MSSYITSLSQTTGAGALLVACILCAAVASMSDEDGNLRPIFFGFAAICAVLSVAFYYVAGKYKADCVLSGSGTCSASLCGRGYWSAVNVSKAAMYGGTCNMSTSLPCYGASLTCGMNACDLGPYDMSPWKATYFTGNKNARWVYSSPGSASSADTKKWGFYNASISSSNASYAVTIEAIVDDSVRGIVWNGNQINLATFSKNDSWVLVPNVSFVPGYNILEVYAQNKAGACGVLFSVTDANNNPILLSGPSTTMMKDI